jgi:hypothetical protein
MGARLRDNPMRSVVLPVPRSVAPLVQEMLFEYVFIALQFAKDFRHLVAPQSQAW